MLLSAEAGNVSRGFNFYYKLIKGQLMWKEELQKSRFQAMWADC